jgi:hypothetical protein
MMLAGVLSTLSLMNRREFIKGLIGTGLYNVLPASLSQGLQYEYKGSTSASQLSERPREKRIFCQIEHTSLESEIEDCARQIGCEVLHGEPFSPDILALGGFIYILDRKLVGKFWWDEYVSIYKQFKWSEPCILVDTIQNLKLPKSPCVIQIDLTDASSTEKILQAIKAMRAQNIVMRLLTEKA